MNPYNAKDTSDTTSRRSFAAKTGVSPKSKYDIQSSSSSHNFSQPAKRKSPPNDSDNITDVRWSQINGYVYPLAITSSLPSSNPSPQLSSTSFDSHNDSSEFICNTFDYVP